MRLYFLAPLVCVGFFCAPNFLRVADLLFYTPLIVCVGLDSLCWVCVGAVDNSQRVRACLAKKNNPTPEGVRLLCRVRLGVNLCLCFAILCDSVPT
jgi:hypothetical protein